MTHDVFGLLGTTIDNRYRVDEVVGEGGFGVVYKGFHLRFGHPIAVKCLKVPPHFTPEAKNLFYAKFCDEGAFLSRLSEHPSIVRVFDLNLTPCPFGGKVPYLVLEWLDGAELEATMLDARKRGRPPMSEADAVALLRPAVDAIALAHTMKIAHRDLKPANLYQARTARGLVLKVLDFGIAKAMQEGETATQLATRTTSGFSAFSPQYGAPEQFVQKKFGATGPWTDVHALGLILSELVSGRSAYEGEEQGEFTVACLTGVRPTPRALGARVSDGFEAMCGKALAMLPRERFQDAGEMLAAMNALGGGAGVGVTVVGTPPGPGETQLPGTTQPPIPKPPEVNRAGKTPSWALAIAGVGVLIGVTGVVLIASSGGKEKAREPSVEAPAPKPVAMKSIPASTFQMGSNEASDEKPVHSVKVEAFEMDETEVTVEAYRACLDAGKCTAPNTGAPCNWGQPKRDDHPVNCVDWEQAKAYCAWALKRLPSEEEWEYAAKGTDGRKYSWGKDGPGTTRACYDQTASGRTCKAGSYPSGDSPFGLKDMAGNVWEWTASAYCPYDNPYCTSSDRVVRGGSWDYNYHALRASFRGEYSPSAHNGSFGLRCARTR